MPLALGALSATTAFFTRQLIIIGVQLGIFWAIDKYVTPNLNKILQDIVVGLGVSEEVASDILANEIITTAESLGLTTALSKAKLPLTIVDKLGFSKRGYAKRKLPASVETKLAGPKNTTAIKEAASVGEIEAITVSMSTRLNVAGSIVGTLLKYVSGFVGVSSLTLLAVAQWMDFANWNGAYEKTFQKFYASLGFPPDSPLPNSKTVSDDTWKRIYATVEELNPQTIAFPWLGEIKPYTRQNLVSAVDHFAVSLAVQGQPATFKTVFGLLLPTIKINPTLGARVATSSGTVSASASMRTASVRVFSGVVSQGFVGSTGQFVERPDDLIESVGELQDAAHNNLAGVVASLPSSLSYEIKIVSSVTTKDGFTQRGTAQKLQVGAYKDGAPRYKTVVNKFATLSLFIEGEKGARTKLRTIVLGPVDALKFQPTTAGLATVEKALRRDLVTSDPAVVGMAVVGAGASAPSTALATQTSQNTPAYIAPQRIANPNYDGVFINRDGSLGDIWAERGGILLHAYPFKDLFTPEMRTRLGSDDAKFDGISDRLRAIGIDPDRIRREPFITDIIVKYQNINKESGVTLMQIFGGSSEVATPPVATTTGAVATSLFEWYSAQGKVLPSVAERSTIYASLGLGQVAFYTGTAEQNTKLLNALKEKPSTA